MLRKFLVSLLLLPLLGWAQGAFTPFNQNTASLAVTGSAQTLTLPGAAGSNRQMVMTNVGPNTVYVLCDGKDGGNPTSVTTSTGMPIMPFSQIGITVDLRVTSCSAIASTTGSTLYATAGLGAFSGTSSGGGAVDSTGSQIVVGNVASGATDSGNPVKVGAKYNSTKPTFTDGQRADLQVGSRGSLQVTLMGPDNTNAVVAGNPGFALGENVGVYTVGQNHTYNGATWDRQTGNQTVSLLASAARTTTQTGADTTNYNAKGIKVYLSVTSAGTGSITVSIQAKDPAGVYYTLLTGAAVTTNSTNTYTIYPGMTVAANVSASDVLSRVFRVVVTHNNANSITYSVGYDLIL